MSEAREFVGAQCASLLDDHAARDYAHKLFKFNAFAEPELRASIRSLDLAPGMRVLDAGCGTGEALAWILDEVAPNGTVVGVDLSAAHIAVAQRHAGAGIQLHRANLFDRLFEPASFDLVWCVNTLNHLMDPIAGAVHLATLLRPNGRLALGQSCLLPDMFFAWDAGLERAVDAAVRRYYQDRYAIDEHHLKAIRALTGTLRHAGLHDITVRTVMIERISPLDAASEAYLAEAIFRGTWGERLRPYLTCAEYAELSMLCDPNGSNYALHRPDFHYLQSFTLATGGL